MKRPVALLSLVLLLHSAATESGGVLLQTSVRHRHDLYKDSTPLRGVGGAFIIMAIAVVTLLVLHFSLRGVSIRKAEILAVVDSDADYSDIWVSQADAPADSDSSVPGLGKRLRESLSFKLPNGTWLHEDSDANISNR